MGLLQRWKGGQHWSLFCAQHESDHQVMAGYNRLSSQVCQRHTSFINTAQFTITDSTLPYSHRYPNLDDQTIFWNHFRSKSIKDPPRHPLDTCRHVSKSSLQGNEVVSCPLDECMFTCGALSPDAGGSAWDQLQRESKLWSILLCSVLSRACGLLHVEVTRFWFVMFASYCTVYELLICHSCKRYMSIF